MIEDIFLGMRVFDMSGHYVGRIQRIGLSEAGDVTEVTLLTPSQGTDNDPLLKAQDFFWLCDPDDPAIINEWRVPDDIPSPPPGQSYVDGYQLGLLDGDDLGNTPQEPPDWLYEEPGQPQETEDGFNDGYIAGIRKSLREKLLKRFPFRTVWRRGCRSRKIVEDDPLGNRSRQPGCAGCIPER